MNLVTSRLAEVIPMYIKLVPLKEGGEFFRKVHKPKCFHDLFLIPSNIAVAFPRPWREASGLGATTVDYSRCSISLGVSLLQLDSDVLINLMSDGGDGVTFRRHPNHLNLGQHSNGPHAGVIATGVPDLPQSSAG